MIPRIITAALLLTLMIPNLNAEPLSVGADAPRVSAVTEAGEKIDLADVYGKQPYTLVYFYPRASTPGCTKQGCSLRDAYEQLTEKGVAVIGVSTDDAAAQSKFKTEQKLPFTLLADPEKKVIEAFGVPAKKAAARQAYLIKGGKIVWADYKGSTDKQAADVLAAVAEIEKKGA